MVGYIRYQHGVGGVFVFYANWTHVNWNAFSVLPLRGFPRIVERTVCVRAPRENALVLRGNWIITRVGCCCGSDTFLARSLSQACYAHRSYALAFLSADNYFRAGALTNVILCIGARRTPEAARRRDLRCRSVFLAELRGDITFLWTSTLSRLDPRLDSRRTKWNLDARTRKKRA